MPCRSPCAEKACNGTSDCKLNMLNYSSCYATSLVCREKRESGGKKRLQRNFRAPRYTLPLGIFTPFISRLMNCLHFVAFQAPQLFALVLVSFVAPGEKRRGELEGIEMCVSLGLFDFNYSYLFVELSFYITKIVDRLKLGMVLVLQSSTHFL